MERHSLCFSIQGLRKKFAPPFKTVLTTALAGSSIGFSALASAVDVNPDRSIFIRDLATLNQFSLDETLQKLLDDSGDIANTPQSLFDSWPGTTNAGCDSEQMFNGFVSQCTTVSLGNTSDYTPIAIANRFDLASQDGSDCGEYRIAFMDRRSAAGGRDDKASFVIFESRLPNPSPEIGLEGCRPVAEFWANLSSIDDTQTRTTHIHDFYFNGLSGFPAVVDADHYRGGENQSGQIRFNQRFSGRDFVWSFFEFRTNPQNGSLNILRSTVKDSPSLTLVTGEAEDNLIQEFENAILEGISTPGKKLLAPSMGTLSYDLPNALNTGSRSNSEDGVRIKDGISNIVLDDVPFVGDSLLTDAFDPASPFALNMQSQLDSVGANLTPTQIMARVNALSCVGCHSQGDDLGAPILFDSTNQNLEMLSDQIETSQTISVEAEDFSEMSGVQTEPTEDFNGGLNVGWLDAGDWMIYNIPLPASSTNRYTISYRVAGMSEGSVAFERPGGGQVWGTMTITPTGSWQEWKTVSHEVEIPAGEQGFALAIQQGGWNLNTITIRAEIEPRMQLKKALKDAFIPEREIHLENFLNNVCNDPSCLDSDQDGVTDNLDQCPNTPVGSSVDNNGCIITSTNILLNGDFSQGSTGWTHYINENAAANLQIGSDAGINFARGNIFNGGFEVWHVQLHQTGVLLEQGKTYQLSFDSFVENGRAAQYQVQLEEDGNDYTSYSPVTTVNANSSNSNTTIQFTMLEATDFNSRLTFNMGGHGDQFGNTPIVIDNVKLIEIH